MHLHLNTYNLNETIIRTNYQNFNLCIKIGNIFKYYSYSKKWQAYGYMHHKNYLYSINEHASSIQLLKFIILHSYRVLIFLKFFIQANARSTLNRLTYRVPRGGTESREAVLIIR